MTLVTVLLIVSYIYFLRTCLLFVFYGSPNDNTKLTHMIGNCILFVAISIFTLAFPTAPRFFMIFRTGLKLYYTIPFDK